MNIQPRPIIKITNIAEIVPDNFSESTFPEGANKTFKNHWNSGADMCPDTGQSTYSRRGCKRMQEGNAQNLEAPRIQMHLSVNPSDDYIRDAQRSDTALWPVGVTKVSALHSAAAAGSSSRGVALEGASGQ